MQYLLCNCDNLEVILFTLIKQGYTLKYSHVGISLLLSGNPYKVLIDKNEKSYYILSCNSDVRSIIGDAEVLYSNDESIILNELGITNVREQKSTLCEEIGTKLEGRILQLLNFSKTEPSDISAMEQFEKILGKNKNKEDNVTNTNLTNAFKAEFLPGRIVRLEIRGQKYFGFILSSKTIAYVNYKGELKGYLNDCLNTFTVDCPYKIYQILIPTASCYQLKDYGRMQVAWPKIEKKITVKKTIAEIEKELGLDPGTLEIR